MLDHAYRRLPVADIMPSVGTSNVVTIARLSPADVASFRELRLRALQADPGAFGSSYQRESRYSDHQWREWVERSATGETNFIALAKSEGVAIGMAGGYQPDHAFHERGVWGMWVDPEWRGEGIGLRLLDAVEQWATGARAERMVLWVVDTNTAAVDLYRRAAFLPTGRTQPLPSDPALKEIEMAKTIAPTSRVGA